MKKQKSMDARVRKIQIKVSEKEWNRLHWLAEFYAGGNLSKWIRHGALNAPRKTIKKARR